MLKSDPRQRCLKGMKCWWWVDCQIKSCDFIQVISWLKRSNVRIFTTGEIEILPANVNIWASRQCKHKSFQPARNILVHPPSFCREKKYHVAERWCNYTCIATYRLRLIYLIHRQPMFLYFLLCLSPSTCTVLAGFPHSSNFTITNCNSQFGSKSRHLMKTNTII